MADSSSESAHRIAARENLTTLQTHILSEEQKYPAASGTFSWILSALALSAKVIADKMRRARIQNVLGALESENVQGERQQKLDVIANDTLLRCLGSRAGVAIVASEEDEKPTLIERQNAGERPYSVLFDPLDGSSNLDTCGTVGTIFSIQRHDRNASSAEGSILQRGNQQVAAGYMLYGSSTVFVLTTGTGVSMFVLDPSIGSFLLVEGNVRIPKKGKTYSVNEGNRASFPAGYQRYLEWAQTNGYSSRYSGAMVADVHRVLLKGGVFFYPPTVKSPQGKLRLLYEVNPMAMIVEQAGGKAIAGKVPVLTVQPEALHQRIACCMGSPDEVDNVLRHLD